MTHNYFNRTNRKPAPNPTVKATCFFPSASGYSHFYNIPVTCKNTQSPVMSFSIFCQTILAKSTHWVENIDNTLSPFKMAEKSLGNDLQEETVEKTDSDKKFANPKVAMALAAGLSAMAPAGVALAEDNSAKVLQIGATTSQQVDCKILAKNHDGTRSEKRQIYSECRDGVLDARIVEQQRILAALNQILANQQMRIDELGRIRDKNGKELARIETINGKLIIRRQQAEQRTTQILDDIERYILDNS